MDTFEEALYIPTLDESLRYPSIMRSVLISSMKDNPTNKTGIENVSNSLILNVGLSFVKRNGKVLIKNNKLMIADKTVEKMKAQITPISLYPKKKLVKP
jgi:hypothetical protein